MKKGQGHIEFILSFLIFLSFAAILFLVLNPFRSSSRIDLLEEVDEEIRDWLEIDLTSYSYKPDTEPSLGGCIGIDKIGEGNVRVKSATNGDVGARISGNKINIKSGKSFYKIFLAENLIPYGESGLESCDSGVIGNYGVPVKRKVFSKQKISDLETMDYLQFKNSLNIDDDFKLTIKKDSGDVFIGKNASQGVSTQARELVIEILDGNAEIEYGRMNLVVW